MEMDSETQRIKPKLNPQAIVDYYYSTDGSGGRRKDLQDLLMKVKQYLLAVGWSFRYMINNCGKKEPRYCPPNAKRRYSSLRTACKAYLDDQLLEKSTRDGVKEVGVHVGSSEAMQLGKREFWIDLFEDGEEGNVVNDLENSSVDDTGSFDIRGAKKRRLDGKNMNKLKRSKGRLRCVNNQNLKEDRNDDVCSICREGGDLMLCDQCPSAYHTHCLGLSEVPASEFWYCPSCCCGVCGLNICRDDLRVNEKQCDQCERRYHGECVGEYYVAEQERKKKWFCCKKCEVISYRLDRLLGNPVVVDGGNLTWTLLKNNDNVNDPETNRKLKRALAVMHECFKSLKEPWGGRDVGEDVIFSRESDLKQLDFRGFYTVILQKGQRVVAFATVRVFGDKVAEVPFIATRYKYRRQGMCKTLMNVLEKKLIKLGVQKLVLPAMLSVLDTWTSPSFAFTEMTASDRFMFMDYNFLEFPGTVACQKLLRKQDDG